MVGLVGSFASRSAQNSIFSDDKHYWKHGFSLPGAKASRELNDVSDRRQMQQIQNPVQLAAYLLWCDIAGSALTLNLSQNWQMTKASIATTMAEQENYGKPANKLCLEMMCHLFNWTKLRCKRVWRAKIKILDLLPWQIYVLSDVCILWSCLYFWKARNFSWDVSQQKWWWVPLCFGHFNPPKIVDGGPLSLSG